MGRPRMHSGDTRVSNHGNQQTGASSPWQQPIRTPCAASTPAIQVSANGQGKRTHNVAGPQNSSEMKGSLRVTCKLWLQGNELNIFAISRKQPTRR